MCRRPRLTEAMTLPDDCIRHETYMFHQPAPVALTFGRVTIAAVRLSPRPNVSAAQPREARPHRPQSQSHRPSAGEGVLPWRTPFGRQSAPPGFSARPPLRGWH
jgi:hypothetical protein